ncbi:MAG: helix-turn-helix transcriptional regulator [Deltaproteobacteria bacterium]|nr:helix-turn-helix transcriptional regulator [Deltaproteobacteria bacterium]
MPISDTDLNQIAGIPKKRDRKKIATVVDFESKKQEMSQRQFAKKMGIARTTVQHWVNRIRNLNASPAMITFFESPDGVAFLHKLVVAAHLEFGKNSSASIHNISNFLKLSGLDPFIASSYSSQRRVSNKMNNAIISFGEFEQERLAKNMPAKKITLCEDETFHPEICMVAIDGVSNYIILEKYVENRSGQTWNNAVTHALAGLPKVEVIQVTSDEAKGLLNHTSKGLGAHHSPDCFHVPHEITKGTSGALAGAVKKAGKQVDVAMQQEQKEINCKNRYESKPKRPRGRRPNFESKIAAASKNVELAKAILDTTRQNQETVQTAKQDIGRLYHPYNPESGEKQDAQCVSDLLETCFADINGAVSGLTDRCTKRVEKAHRVVKSMVSTIAFFFLTVDVHLKNKGIQGSQKHIMHQYLIPGFYLEQVGRKERDPARKESILAKSQEFLSILSDPNGHMKNYSDDEVMVLKDTAKECAGIFQRSSSCVEGRNAQLSLRHHGLHRLSERLLNALTVVHNFHIRNRDGTTPAERFFQAEHGDLFEWLLENMEYPARPRKRSAVAA